MSLSELDRYITKRREELGLINDNSKLSIPYDTPFYLWDDKEHQDNTVEQFNDCCAWHLLGGAPTITNDNNNLVVMPPLPYQKTLYEDFSKAENTGTNKLFAVLKARGIGMTYFILKYLAYNALTGRYRKGSRIIWSAGPRIQTAQDAISRLKDICTIRPEDIGNSSITKPTDKLEKSNSTEFTVNGVTFSCFPSWNSSSMRGYTNVVCIVGDEFSWWPTIETLEFASVITGYQTKASSNPLVILLSTSNNPEDAMQNILNDKKSQYRKYYLPYEMGLNVPYPIYSRRQIEEARKSREFLREMSLQPIGVTGSLFTTQSLDYATSIRYDPDLVIPNSVVSVGVDPSYSSYGIVVTRLVEGHLEIVAADIYERENAMISNIIQKIRWIKQKHGINALYCDSAAPEHIAQFRRDIFREPYKQQDIERYDKLLEQYHQPLTQYNKCVSISFNKYGSQMLSLAKDLMDRNYVLIDKRFDKLLIALRTANATEFKYDKTSPYDDLLDAFRLSLFHFRMVKE